MDGPLGPDGPPGYKLKELAVKEAEDMPVAIKGPVTAVTSINGHLAVAQGPNPGMIGGAKVSIMAYVLSDRALTLPI